MIYLDSRIGSKPGGVHDLHDLLAARGLPVAMDQLAYGDVAFVGAGPDGRPVSVGIEIKALSDLLSCLTTGRFTGQQLEGLVTTYEIPFLFVVGIWREGDHGNLETPTGRGWVPISLGSRTWRHSQVLGHLNTVTFNARCHVRRLPTKQDLVSEVHALYSWWSQGSEHHRSHISLPPVGFSRISFLKPSRTQLMLTQVAEGVGQELSGRIESHFKHPDTGKTDWKKLVDSSVEEWCKIPGIGKTLARKIKETLS